MGDPGSNIGHFTDVITNFCCLLAVTQVADDKLDELADNCIVFELISSFGIVVSEKLNTSLILSWSKETVILCSLVSAADVEKFGRPPN